MFNLSVSNVRGPRRPFYLLGAELDEAYTLAPLGAEHALSVAFFTYRDGVHFAFQADPDVPSRCCRAARRARRRARRSDGGVRDTGANAVPGSDN